MKAVIIDDERLARAELRRLLAAHAEIEIAGEACNGDEALSLIGQTSPDLLLLDVQMPGLTGFDVLERLDDVPQVIFTTAYDAYAIKAFEVNALDYLMKPIAPARLAAALAKVARAPAPRAWSVYSFAMAIAAGSSCSRYLPAGIRRQLYARLHFNGQRPLIRRSLNALEAQLDPAVFFRANRQQILNLKWIDKVDLGVAGGLSVTLRGGRAVEMSRRQSGRLREILSL